MLFKLTALALLGLVASQSPTPDGICPETNSPLTHLADKNSCVYFFVCHNGQPLLMPRCRTGHIWDGTQCREGVCEDLPPVTTPATTVTDTDVSVTEELTTLTPDQAPSEIPTAPVIPPTATELSVTLP